MAAKKIWETCSRRSNRYTGGQETKALNYGDELTSRILSVLAEAPRASNKRIAAIVGASEATVASRIRMLQAEGVMRVVLQRDIHASSPNSVAAIVEFFLERSDAIAEAAAVIGAFDDIFSVYQTARRPELIVNCRSESPKALDRLLMQLAQAVPHLQEMHSLPILSLGRYSTVLGTLRRYPQKPREGGDDQPMLAKLLQEDGRQSISSLARQLGLSITATRYRLTKLLEQPGVHIGLVCDTEVLGITTWFDVRAKVRPSCLKDALERFSGRDNVRVVAHLAGENNLALFLLCRSVEEADRFVTDEIRALPGLLDFSLMRVPNVHKFDYNFNL